MLLALRQISHISIEQYVILLLYQVSYMSTHGDGLLWCDAKSSMELVGRLFLTRDVLQLPTSHLHFLHTTHVHTWLSAQDECHKHIHRTSAKTESKAYVQIA